MGMTRIGSDGSLANSNLLQSNIAVANQGNAEVFFGAAKLAQRAVIRAGDANVGTISIGPDTNTNLVTLSLGDEYTLAGQPGTTFDLSKWNLKGTHNTDVLRVLYQP